ncbi:MAG: hypothetical protein LBC41_13170 [Clostridiales bacterium]|nr:hypothetical protein [Clostridiales bacterium]
MIHEHMAIVDDESKILFELEINRKITLLQDESGTGKTDLMRLLSESVAIGYSIKSTVKWGMLAGTSLGSWAGEKRLVFVDGNCPFLSDANLHELIENSKCLFVIFSRNPNLPYEMSSLFRLAESDDHSSRLIPLYDLNRNVYSKPELALIKVSEQMEYYKDFFAQANIECKTASSNKDLIKLASQENSNHSSILLIIDSKNSGCLSSFLSHAFASCVFEIFVFNPSDPRGQLPIFSMKTH